MSIAAISEPAPSAALRRARDEVASLDGQLWAAVADDELVEVEEQIADLRSQLAALEVEVLVEVDRRDLARKRLSWGSTGDWLAHTAGISRAAAKRVLDEARDLVDERRETHAALRDGAISPAHAAVICRGIADLPGDRLLRRRAEIMLLDEATRLDATDLARAARHVLHVVDPDGVERRAERELEREERAAHRRRFLSIGDDGAGGIRITGRGSVEDGATLRAALLPMSAPEPSVDPATGEELGRDPRDHGARTWDALVRVAQHSLDTEAGPTDHGATPRIAITMAIDDLLTALDRPSGRRGTTDDGLDLAPAAVRRLACDARIVPVVLGTTGEVLDVGRTYRSAPEKIWLALVVRDRHCAFPGCRRPPIMCHAHHIVHWADGGDTALSNLVLLCGHHHRTIHHTPWLVRLNAEDQRPEFLPPPGHRARAAGSDELPAGDSRWIRHRPRRE